MMKLYKLPALTEPQRQRVEDKIDELEQKRRERSTDLTDKKYARADEKFYARYGDNEDEIDEDILDKHRMGWWECYDEVEASDDICKAYQGVAEHLKCFLGLFPFDTDGCGCFYCDEVFKKQ